MQPRIYILIPGEGICIVTDAELSRLCADGRQYFRLRRLSSEHLESNSEHLNPVRF